MSEQRFQQAKGSLAFSQSVVDRFRAEQQQMGQDMAPPTPAEQPTVATQMPQNAPQQAQPTDMTQPTEAPDTAQESPKEDVQEAPKNDTKSMQNTVKELSDTIGTGFDALNKVADALKDITGKKEPSES